MDAMNDFSGDYGGVDSQNAFAYPDFAILESKKDKDWHRRVGMAVLQESQFYTWEYEEINESYKRFNGLFKTDAFDFLQQSEDGSAMPAVWIDYNGINPMVKLLVGDLMQRSVELGVKALNKDALSRRLKKTNEMRVKMKLRPIFQEIQQGTGLNLAPDTVQMSEGSPAETPMPETEDELERLMRDNYKDITEECVKRILDYFIEKTHWKTKRAEFFINLPIASRCIAKVEWDNGLPVPEMIDPRAFFFDHNCKGDFLDDAAHMGSVRYMEKTKILARYDITPEQLQKLGTSQSVFYGGRVWTMVQIINRKVYYLVANVEFADTKPTRFVETKPDKYGTVHTKEEAKNAGKPLPKEAVSEGDGIYSLPSGERIISKRKRTVRYVTMVGNQVVEFGELQNQVRSIDDFSLADSGYSYVAAFPYWIDGANVSMVHLMSGIEDFKNITMYNLQKAMAVAGVKGITIDVSQLPPNMEVKDVMHYIKAAGVNIVNTGEEGLTPRGGSGGIQTWDMTMADVSGYLNTMAFLDARAERITGMSEARQGFVQNSSQAVGVTNASLNQSNLHTAYVYDIFNAFTERLFTKIVNQFKISVKREDLIDHYSAILGDATMAFVQSGTDLALDDYGVFIEFMPDIVQNRQKYEAMIQEGLQTKAIAYEDAIELLLEKDTALGLRMLKAKARKRAEEARAHEKEMAAQQAQAMMQNTQLQGQNQMGVAQQNNQTRLQDTAMRNTAQERIAHAGNNAALHGQHIQLAGRERQQAPA